MSKGNSNADSAKPKINITARNIKSTRGGWLSIRKGRTSNTRNRKNNPLNNRVKINPVG